MRERLSQNRATDRRRESYRWLIEALGCQAAVVNLVGGRASTFVNDFVHDLPLTYQPAQWKIVVISR